MKLQPTKLFIPLILLLLCSFNSLQAQFNISGDNSVDPNVNENYTISNSSGSNIVNVQWSVIGVDYTIVTGQGTSSATIKFTGVGSATVRAVVVYGSSFSSAYPQKSVTVNGTVVGQVNFTSGLTTRCRADNNSDYNATASNATSYTWTIENAGASTINANTGLVNWSGTFAGTARVRVTAYGPNNSQSTAFRDVTVSAGPTLSSLEPNSGTTICSGESTTITLGSGVTGTTYKLYRGTTLINTRTPSSFGVLNWDVSIAGTYKIIANDGGSCGDIESNTVVVTTAQNLGNPSISGGVSTRCKGSGTSDFNISSGSSQNSYSWSMENAGSSTINSTTGVVSWSSIFSGTATVKAIATSACGATTTLTKTVTVSAGPTLSSLEPSSGTTICSGESTTITLGSGVTGTTYKLYRGTTLINTRTPSSFGVLNWDVSIAGTYKIIANDGGSCGDIESNTVVVTTAQNLGNPSISGGVSTRCKGSGTSDFNISSGSSQNSYSWSMENAGSSTINSSGVVSWSPIFSGTATVKAIATSACGATATLTKTVTVSAGPTLSSLEPSNGITICSGESTTITLGSGVTGTTYKLYRGTTLINTRTPSSFGVLNWDVSIAGTYKIIANDGGSCGDIESNTVVVTTAQNLGNPSISGGVSTRCKGSGTSDFNISSGSSQNSYSWSIENAGSSTINSTTGVVSWSSIFSGTATVKTIATSTCGATTLLEKTVTVTTPDAYLRELSLNTPPPSSSNIPLEFSFNENGGTTYAELVLSSGSCNSPLEVTFLDTIDNWATFIFNSATNQIEIQVEANTEEQRATGSRVAINGTQIGILGVNQEGIIVTPPPPSCTASGVSDISFAAGDDDVQFTIAFNPNTAPCAQTVFLKAISNSNTNLLDPPNWLLIQRLNGNTFKLSVAANTTAATRSVRLVTVNFNDQAVGQLNFLVTQPNCASEGWYLDSDGDGLGDIFGQPIMGCQDPDTYPNDDPNTSWVNNNGDKCPYDFGPISNQGCPGDIPENWNTVTTRSYDLNNTLKIASKSYFDQLGKLRQTQGWDVKSDSIWASATLYDNYGRQALNTIGAPIKKGVVFQYKTGFIKSSNNVTDYILKTNPTLENILDVGNNVNTLGWYYSERNDREPYQDVTAYPFSRSIYSKLNPGGILQTAGGNKINSKWPQAYTFSMPAGQELSKSIAFGNMAYDNLKIIKTVSRNLQGEENVVFTDSEGRTLAAARSGSSSASRNSTIKIGEQGFVDIHVPQETNGISTANLSSGMNIEVYDLITEELYTSLISSIPHGFYRVSIKNWNPDSYNPNQQVQVTYPENYYDYTLSVYDKADNIVKSYQPVGTSIITKPESLVTYDALGRIIYSKSPDEGEAWFRYREDGQLRYSQNSKQKTEATNEEFSYTNYDALGRPVESGMVESTSFSTVSTETLSSPPGVKKEQLFTVYDEVDDTELLTLPSNYQTPSFLSSNVAKTENNQSTSYYSYDIYGRIQWVVQNIVGLGFKTIDYEYEPITGLVTKVIYQKYNTDDKFVHRYLYNEIDELVRVETSTDNINFTIDAEYEYYETGTMKRTELAGVQGIDYVYNFSGQLKSINHPSLDNTKDPGGDTNDLFGMQIDYHSSDYQRSVENIQARNYGLDRVDGNLKGVRWNNRKLLSGSVENTYSYEYDRNKWLKSAQYGTYSDIDAGSIPENDFDNGTYTNSDDEVVKEATKSITLQEGFHAEANSRYIARIIPGQNFQQNTNGDYNVTDIVYDANGNIKQLKRNKQTENGINAMDDLTYNYDVSKPNQLRSVSDADGDVANAKDIGNQATNNYVYNSIGQLIEDHEYVTPTDVDNIVRYEYSTSGLVTKITKKNVPLVKFVYNDRNQRVQKQSFTSQGILVKTTYYVRDVNGGVKGIYESLNGNAAVIAEHPVMGNGRIGIYKRAGNSGITYYELTDHLGNVRSVFNKNELNTASYSDYYPFGMQMPGRNSLSNNFYRYAFQGQEKDSETDREAFELRLWDARIGRWLTTDPAGQYPSPYLGMGNNPLSRIDPDGGQDCDCENDPPAFFRFFISLFDNISKTVQSMSSSGPNPIFVDQVNQQVGVLAAMTTEIEKTNRVLGFAIEAELAVITMGNSSLATGLLTRGGLFSLSTKGFRSRVLFETGTELLVNDFDPFRVNLIGIAASIPASNLSSEFIGNTVSFTINDGVQSFTVEEATVNFAVGRANEKIHSNLQSATSLLGNNGSIKALSNSLFLAQKTGTNLLTNEFLDNE